MKGETSDNITYGHEYDDRLRKARKGLGRLGRLQYDVASGLRKWDKPCPPTRFEVLG